MASPVLLVATTQLPSVATGIRITLHVLAAAIFVGGQFTVAGLLGTVRGFGEGATKAVAHAFGRLQWPAYFILILTGFWNVAAIHSGTTSHAWFVVLSIKIAVALLAGLFAYLHQRSRSRAQLAAFGGLAGISSLVALILGALLSA
jgi:hypothetical protein